MDFEEAWNQALKKTEIIRARVAALQTHADTKVPYIFLSESLINVGDTVVRSGEICVQKPALIVPPNNPQFSGFELEEENGFHQNSFINFLIVRGIQLPSFRYNNSTSNLDIYEGKLSKAIKHYEKELQQKENVHAGLLTGPEDVWQFSLLIFVVSQVMKNSETDIKKLIKNLKDSHET